MQNNIQKEKRFFNKIPNLASYSKEDLYEEAMRAKMAFNTLKDEYKSSKAKFI